MPLKACSDSLQAPPEGPRQPTSSPILALPLTLHSTALPLRRWPCAGSTQTLCSSMGCGLGLDRHQCGISTGMRNHLWQCATADCAVLEGGAICRDVRLLGVAVANVQRHLTAYCPLCSAGSVGIVSNRRGVTAAQCMTIREGFKAGLWQVGLDLHSLTWHCVCCLCHL